MRETPATCARGFPGKRVDPQRAGITISERMTWVDSISASDRDLMKRLTIVLAFIFLFVAAFSRLERFYSGKFFDATGGAEWIWAQHPMNRNLPVAFFATRDLPLPEQRHFTHVKILGDPEYTLYVNGHEVGGRRLDSSAHSAEEQRTLARYDVSDLVRTGVNRIVLAVRSPQGFGGLIAAIDIGSEMQNWAGTDAEWRIYRQWHPELVRRDPPRLSWERPLIIGEPPVGRWNYLTVESAGRAEAPSEVQEPLSTLFLEGRLPKIQTSGGVAVAVNERHAATLFDFGLTSGRIRVTLNQPQEGSSSIPVRLFNHRDEAEIAEWNFRPFVFAPGELSVTTPEVYHFRYVMAYARDVRVEVVR
jgi:hypothetical protein